MYVVILNQIILNKFQYSCLYLNWISFVINADFSWFTAKYSTIGLAAWLSADWNENNIVWLINSIIFYKLTDIVIGLKCTLE